MSKPTSKPAATRAKSRQPRRTLDETTDHRGAVVERGTGVRAGDAEKGTCPKATGSSATWHRTGSAELVCRSPSHASKARGRHVFAKPDSTGKTRDGGPTAR